MRKAIVDNVNELIEKCIDGVVEDEMAEKYRFMTIIGEDKQYSILASEAKLYDSTVDDLWHLESSFEDTVSRTVIDGMLQDFIFEMKEAKEYATEEKLELYFVQSLKKLPIQKFEVIHEIYGLKVESIEPIQIGKFCFYNYKKHRKRIMENLQSVLPLGTVDYFKGKTMLVSVMVEAREKERACEKAIVAFDQLQNIFRYIIWGWGFMSDIGVLNYNGRLDDKFFIRSSQVISCDTRSMGAWWPIKLESLLRDCAEFGIDLFELIANIGTSVKQSAMKIRIMRAIDFLGRSAYDTNKPVAFLQAMMAIEALLQFDIDRFVQPSITAQITEYSAFILEDVYEKRCALEKTIRDMYRIRSKLAHGSSQNVTASDIRDVQYLGKRLIDAFLSNEELRTIKDEKELREYITKLKYS